MSKTKATARRTARVMWEDKWGVHYMRHLKSMDDQPVLVLPLDPASRARYVEDAAKALPDIQHGETMGHYKNRAGPPALSAVDPRLVGDIRRARKAGKGSHG